MTDQKILQVLNFYQAYLERINEVNLGRINQAKKADYDRPPNKIEAFNHLLAMIPEMREFLKQGRREKVFRWLGFIQGVLWLGGLFTLDELKNHSKPEGEEK